MLKTAQKAHSIKQSEDYHDNRLIIDVQPGFYKKVIVSRERVSVFTKWLWK
jgi:hypothetical protein